MRLKGKRVLVYGMGISGQAACKLLHEKGAIVSIYDDEKRFSGYFNFEKEPMKRKYNLVVISPGVKILGNALVSHFLIEKTPLISELDLGYLNFHGQIIAITGTNGKTTVSSLCGDIFKKSGKKTFVCGNIGLPLSSVALSDTKNSYAICEVSNFQLEGSKYFTSNLSCVTNITPDHLDRHGSMEEYIRVKRKIISKKRGQKVVLNLDDDIARSFCQDNKKVLFFSKRLLNKGVFVKNNAIYFNKTKVISLNDIPLFGEKNLENVLASVAIACKYRIKPAVIKKAIMEFKAPAHRLEWLGQVEGAEVFDDSKATNIAASLASINSLGDKNLVVLFGGENKNCEFDELFNKGYDYEQIICFGQSGEEIADCARKYGYTCEVFPTMKQAADFVRAGARSGQKILLAPACASFDEFASYAARGEIFKEIMFGNYQKIEMSS